MLLVSDVRQYTYCPRVVYYHHCWPRVRPTTYKMQAGQAAHTQEPGKEKRRSLFAYNIKSGKRSFDVNVEDSELGLRGRLDMTIYCENEVIPVEYKHSPGRLGHHVVLQVVAYGMLLERAGQKPARRGFVYYTLARRSREIELSTNLKDEGLSVVEAMQEMIANERMPAPPRSRRRCELCEFRRFCNDVV